MTWRDAARPVGAGNEGLTLETVLTHYGIGHTSRRKQMIRCPIQGDDSNPSLSLDLDKQLWKCHSCGKGGDVWVLIMELEGVEDYGTARRFAEATFGIAGGDIGRRVDEVRGRAAAGRRGRGVSSGAKDRRKNGGYQPSWRSY